MENIGGQVVRSVAGIMVLAAAVLTGGCGVSVRPYGVPGAGQLVGEAPGKPASFTAPREGTVWVAGPGRPGQDRYIVYSGLIKAGQTITVDPTTRSVTINGEHPIANIESGNSFYQIWYLATAEE